MCNTDGSGAALSGPPTRKCPSVNAFRSLESEDNWHSGREFRIASICVSRV